MTMAGGTTNAAGKDGAAVLSLSGQLDAGTAPVLTNANSGALEHSRGSANGNGGMTQ